MDIDFKIRNLHITYFFLKGHKVKDIMIVHNITRERVYQIVRREMRSIIIQNNLYNRFSANDLICLRKHKHFFTPMVYKKIKNHGLKRT